MEITKLFKIRATLSKSNILSEDEIRWLCNESKSIFMSQPVYLELISPLYVGGIKIIALMNAINEYIYFFMTTKKFFTNNVFILVLLYFFIVLLL